MVDMGRKMMVSMDLSYHAFQAASVAREVAIGYRNRKDNPFC